MQMRREESIDLSVIMPCRNEEQTVGFCIEEARGFIKKRQLKGEILIVDNGSTDRTAEIAVMYGARVVLESKRGYGNAIRTGMTESRGSVLIIGDGDTTYDFLHLDALYESLAEGRCDMVIGNRYTGGMEKGSMPLLHYWGVRFLSFCGRKRFHTEIYDFHCGLRGIRREAAEKLSFHTTGMEFATEMIAEAGKKQLCVKQVPVVLRKSLFKRESKLRTIRDGFRHLIYIIKGGRI